MLVPCPACGNPCAEDALSCPKCGKRDPATVGLAAFEAQHNDEQAAYAAQREAEEKAFAAQCEIGERTVAAQRRAQGRTRRQFGVIVACVGLLFLVSIVWSILGSSPYEAGRSGAPGPPSSPSTDDGAAPQGTSAADHTSLSPRAVGVGDKGRLRAGSLEEIVLAASPEAYDAFVKASVARDQMGIAELVVSKQLFKVPAGTQVLVIDEGGFVGSRMKVRILEGESAGETGWVPFEWVH